MKIPLSWFRVASVPALLVLSSCGSTTPGGVGDGGGSTSSFAGTYAATFTGTFQNTSPNTESGPSSSTATITVTSESAKELKLSWQVPPNPPSGSIVFQMSGSSGKLLDPLSGPDATPGAASNGSCFVGLVNGNAQTNCCTTCTVSFSGDTMTQPNSGFYTGLTPLGVAYKGTYSGTWTAKRQ